MVLSTQFLGFTTDLEVPGPAVPKLQKMIIRSKEVTRRAGTLQKLPDRSKTLTLFSNSGFKVVL